MKSHLSLTATLFSCLFALPPAGCSKKTTEASDQGAASATSVAPTADGLVVPITFTPKGDQAKALDELRRKVDKKHQRFNNKEINRVANARLFVYIAASSSEPEVIAAALQAMAASHSTHSKRKATPDDDYRKVVRHYLSSNDNRIKARALQAARSAISGRRGDPKLIADVVKLAENDKSGPARYAVIDTLRVVSEQNRTPEMMNVFATSLDSPDAYLVSYALQALHRSARSIQDRENLTTRVTKLAKHPDPGVRGRALELLGSIARDQQPAIDLMLASLQDKNPYVRSEACDALSRSRYTPAIHAIVSLLDDRERNRYDLRGWTTLEGRPGTVHHDGSAWGYVYDAATSAIKSLSRGAFKLERVNPKNVTETLDRNAQAAKDWYDKNKGTVPNTQELVKMSDAKNAKATPAKPTTPPAKSKTTQPVNQPPSPAQ